MVTIEIINNSEQFYGMRQLWNEILEKSGIENPYITHEFLSSWWRAYQKGKELSVTVFKDNDVVIGLAPLAIVKTKLTGFPVKALQFFADHWGTMDFILLQKQQECLERFVELFVSEAKSHVLLLSRMPQDSENARILLSILKGKNVKFEQKEIKNAVINLEGSWDEYLSKRSKKFRYQLKDKQKRLSQAGTVAYERMVELNDASSTVDLLAAISNNSWKGEDKLGIASTQEGRQFYHYIIDEWGKSKQLDLSLLKLNSTPIAYAMRLNYKNKYYALETSYNNSYYDYSPGMLVQGQLLEQLISEGAVKTYELGQEDESKARWVDDFAQEVNFCVYNPSLFSKVLHYVRGLRLRGRQQRIKTKKAMHELNVLMIGSGGEELLQETNNLNNFVHFRHKQYADKINSLHIVVKCLKNDQWKERRLSEKLFTYPTNSRGYKQGLIDLYRLSCRIIKERDIDLIVTSDPFGSGLVGYLLKLKFRKPLCIQMFADYAFNELWRRQNIQKYLGSLLARFLFRHADSIRVISEELKDRLAKEASVDPKKVFTYHIFVKREQFLHKETKDIRKEILGEKFSHLVLSVGRLAFQKDFSTLIKSAKAVIEQRPDTLFLIIGNGPERSRLEQFTRELGMNGNVRFVGFVPYEQMPLYYKACDLFVLSSVCEDTARVLVEAALCGKPIVTTDTTGARSVVRDNENGYVVAIKDYGALAQKTISLIDNDSLRMAFGKRSSEIVEDMFDEKKIINGIASMWYATVYDYSIA